VPTFGKHGNCDLKAAAAAYHHHHHQSIYNMYVAVSKFWLAFITITWTKCNYSAARKQMQNPSLCDWHCGK